MKKACRELEEVQREAVFRRQLFESGRIRVERIDPKTAAEKKEHDKERQEAVRR